MKKKFTKEELISKSAAYFKANPKVKEFLATEDGMFFTNASHAHNHNKVVKGKIQTISRIDGPKQKAVAVAIGDAPKQAEGLTDPAADPEGDQEAPEETAKEQSEAAADPEGTTPEGAPDLEALQAEYEQVTGNKPGNRKAETLLKEIEEAKKETK